MNPFIHPTRPPTAAGRIIRAWLTVAGLALPSGLVAGLFLGSMLWGCSATVRHMPEIKVTVTHPEPTPAVKPSRR